MLQRHLISLTAITALSLTLTGCNDADTSDPRTHAPLVRTGVIQAASVSTRTFTGVVAAKVQSDLGFRVAGKIKERFQAEFQSNTEKSLSSTVIDKDLVGVLEVIKAAVLAGELDTAIENAANKLRDGFGG